MAIIPTRPPVSFRAGDFVTWREVHGQFLAPEWTLTVTLTSDSMSESFDALPQSMGDHIVELSSAETAELEPGEYRYQVTVSDGEKRFTVRAGVISCLQDLAAAEDGHDGRSDAAQIFDAITAVLKGKANHDQATMSIGDKSITRYSFDELIGIRGHFAHQMTDGERMARGLAPRTPHRVRFSR